MQMALLGCLDTFQDRGGPLGRLSTTPMQRPRAITVPPSEPATVFAVVAVVMVYDSCPMLERTMAVLTSRAMVRDQVLFFQIP